MFKKYTIFVSSTDHDSEQESQVITSILSELCEENRKLKDESDNIKDSDIFSKSLASGEDEIEIEFNIYNVGETEFPVDSLSIRMTWNDIFKQIGCELIEGCGLYSIKTSICKIGIKKYFELLNDSEKIEHFKNHQFIKIAEHSIRDILIQFIALDYIKIRQPNDQDLSQENKFILTKTGINTLVYLTAKRKS